MSYDLWLVTDLYDTLEFSFPTNDLHLFTLHLTGNVRDGSDFIYFLDIGTILMSISKERWCSCSRYCFFILIKSLLLLPPNFSKDILSNRIEPTRRTFW